jgi:prefoldin subunit 5
MSNDEQTKPLPEDSPLYALQKEIARLGNKIDALDAKVNALDDKVEARLHDTRPMWESVNAQLQQTNQRLYKIEREMRKLNLSFKTVASDHVELRSISDDHERRLIKIEDEAS